MYFSGARRRRVDDSGARGRENWIPSSRRYPPDVAPICLPPILFSSSIPPLFSHPIISTYPLFSLFHSSLLYSPLFIVLVQLLPSLWSRSPYVRTRYNAPPTCLLKSSGPLVMITSSSNLPEYPHHPSTRFMGHRYGDLDNNKYKAKKHSL